MSLTSLDHLERAAGVWAGARSHSCLPLLMLFHVVSLCCLCFCLQRRRASFLLSLRVCFCWAAPPTEVHQRVWTIRNNLCSARLSLSSALASAWRNAHTPTVLVWQRLSPGGLSLALAFLDSDFPNKMPQKLEGLSTFYFLTVLGVQKHGLYPFQVLKRELEAVRLSLFPS